jgi:hypothetical protein
MNFKEWLMESTVHGAYSKTGSDPLYLYATGNFPMTPVIFNMLKKDATNIVAGHLLAPDRLCDLVDSQDSQSQISSFTRAENVNGLKGHLEAGDLKNLVAFLVGDTFLKFPVDVYSIIDSNKHRWIYTTEFMKNYGEYMDTGDDYYDDEDEEQEETQTLMDLSRSIERQFMAVISKSHKKYNVDESIVKDIIGGNRAMMYGINSLRTGYPDAYDYIYGEMQKFTAKLYTSDLLYMLHEIAEVLSYSEGKYNEVLIHNFKIHSLGFTDGIEPEEFEDIVNDEGDCDKNFNIIKHEMTTKDVLDTIDTIHHSVSNKH